MTLDRSSLVQSVFDALPADPNPAAEGIVISELVRTALGPHLAQGDVPTDNASTEVATLDALCRQIDVRKKLAAHYGQDFAKVSNETDAAPAVIVGAVALLLSNATLLQQRHDTTGRALKYINSANKALDLATTPHVPSLRGWAIELLDKHAQGAAA